MQGSLCWAVNIIDSDPTGKRSIFTRLSRVKNALAFLHGVFTNLFGRRKSNFRPRRAAFAFLSQAARPFFHSRLGHFFRVAVNTPVLC